MSRVFKFLVLMVSAIALAGCETSSGGANICDPGVYQECPCAGGEAGVQQCDDSGDRWGDCSCDPGGWAVVDGSSGDVALSSDVTEVEPEAGPTEDVEICQPQWEKVCNGDVIVWVDSCGMLGDTIESCAEVGYCSSGACVEACLPKAEERCAGNSIYWFNSCGEKESVSVTCGEDEFCVGCHEDDELCSKDAQCVKGFYDGEWKITADPKEKDACGMGPSTYFDLIVDLVVNEDGTVDATGDVLEYDLHYTGTLVGKDLEMSATYSQTSAGLTINHVELIDVDFTSLDTFEGLSADTFTIPLLGDCTLYWDITGVRQD
jgi:hypothetical protein